MASIYLQMGHCFRTTGVTGTAGEQEFNKSVAARAARLLRARGHDVFVRRADDPNFKTDVFAAFHADGSVSPDAHGASVGHQDSSGQRIANAWKHAYQRMGFEGGFRPDNNTEGLAQYYGVRDALEAGTRFAFIIEAGFLTNPDEGAALRTRKGKMRVAKALTRAIGEVVGHPHEP